MESNSCSLEGQPSALWLQAREILLPPSPPQSSVYHHWSSVALPHTEAIIELPQVCPRCLMDHWQMRSQKCIINDVSLCVVRRIHSQNVLWCLLKASSVISERPIWSAVCVDASRKTKGNEWKAEVDDSLIRRLEAPLFTEHHRFLIPKLELHLASCFLALRRLHSRNNNSLKSLGKSTASP